MKSNFDACLTHVLRHEGLWSDHSRDPGGATMKGVTLAVYRKHRPGATKEQLRNITDKEVRDIYRTGYWNVVRGDDLPKGLDLVAFDAAVNSGPSRGAKWLQQALGTYADGQIGALTLIEAKRADPVKTILRACENRMKFLRGLSTFDVFGKGWTRRVKEVEEAALAMVSAQPFNVPKHGTPVSVPPGLEPLTGHGNSWWGLIKKLLGW